MEQKSILMGMSLKETNQLVSVLKSKQIACWGSQLIPNMGAGPSLVWKSLLHSHHDLNSICPQKSCPPLLLASKAQLEIHCPSEHLIILFIVSP